MFGQLHPIVLAAYFICAAGFSMSVMNPVCLIISLICAFINSAALGGAKKTLSNLKLALPVTAVAAIMNPAFNHRGATIILYLANGNPLTLESIVYGAAAGVMLASVMCHFSYMSTVMTSDKLIYLSGRAAPALSLVFSMSLRLVPRFTRQLGEVNNALKCIGRGISSGGLIRRIKNGAAIISIMITWALENAADTADSMRSRGYGLKGRTSFSLFHFDTRDAVILVLMLSEAAYIIYACVSKAVYWRYFPAIAGAAPDMKGTAAYIIYAALLIMPCIIELYYKSRAKQAVKKIR